MGVWATEFRTPPPYNSGSSFQANLGSILGDQTTADETILWATPTSAAVAYYADRRCLGRLTDCASVRTVMDRLDGPVAGLVCVESQRSSFAPLAVEAGWSEARQVANGLWFFDARR